MNTFNTETRDPVIPSNGFIYLFYVLISVKAIHRDNSEDNLKLIHT